MTEKQLQLQIQQLEAELQIAHQKLQAEIDYRCLTEKKLLREQQLLQIIDTIPSLIFVNSHDGELILQNQAAARICESNTDFNCTNQSQDQIIQFDVESTSISEETFTLSTGESRNFQVAKTQILFDDDDKKYYVTICNDITANNLPKIDFLDEDGNKARQMICTFVTTTSHEFRTPLTTILGSTELLKYYRNNWSEEKINKYLNRIEDSVKHMMQMLDNLLFLENEM